MQLLTGPPLPPVRRPQPEDMPPSCQVTRALLRCNVPNELSVLQPAVVLCYRCAASEWADPSAAAAALLPVSVEYTSPLQPPFCCCMDASNPRLHAALPIRVLAADAMRWWLPVAAYMWFAVACSVKPAAR